MKYKKPKLCGTDVLFKGIIEQIETGKYYDKLDLCNRRLNLWVLSVFNGYRQIGQFKIKKPHGFKEGDLVIIKKYKGKIISVKIDTITVSNIKDVFHDD